MEADAVRRRLHPEGVVSYVVGTTVDCTALLLAAKDDRDPEVQLDLMCGKIGAAAAMGATGVRVTGDVKVKSEAGLRWVEGMLREVRRLHPALWIEGLTSTDIAGAAGRCGMPAAELMARLRDAGLDTIAGDSSGCSVGDWLETHRVAHGLGMRTAAEIVFGGDETAEQRVDLLDAVRRLQEETGGFAAFVPVAAEAPGGRELDGVTAVERLKTLAIARMLLDNIENVQSSRAGDGLKVLQMGLRFGANDVGSVAAAGGSDQEDVRRIIRDAGFQPAERDMAYRAMMLN
jgi:cyclic dehypoxanthinyl futalosine synthase